VNKMIWIAIIVIVILILVFAKKGKKEEECIECEPEEETCTELKKLVVYYNGMALATNEVVKIANNVKTEFRVLGYDITGTKDACVDGGDITWDKSCPCTFWENTNGLVNRVWTNNKILNTPRSVWVKHKTGVTFKWKTEVV